MGKLGCLGVIIWLVVFINGGFTRGELNIFGHFWLWGWIGLFVFGFIWAMKGEEKETERIKQEVEKIRKEREGKRMIYEIADLYKSYQEKVKNNIELSKKLKIEKSEMYKKTEAEMIQKMRNKSEDEMLNIYNTYQKQLDSYVEKSNDIEVSTDVDEDKYRYKKISIENKIYRIISLDIKNGSIDIENVPVYPEKLVKTTLAIETFIADARDVEVQSE